MEFLFFIPVIKHQLRRKPRVVEIIGIHDCVTIVRGTYIKLKALILCDFYKNALAHLKIYV